MWAKSFTATENVDSDACTVVSGYATSVSSYCSQWLIYASGTTCPGSVMATVATDGTCVQSVGQSVSVTCSASSTSTGSTSSNGDSGSNKALYGLLGLLYRGILYCGKCSFIVGRGCVAAAVTVISDRTAFFKQLFFLALFQLHLLSDHGW